MHTQSVVSCRMEHEAFQLEKQHVHKVYESTASYFNDLQGKAWPRVRQFLLEQKPGSLIADIGKFVFFEKNLSVEILNEMEEKR